MTDNEGHTMCIGSSFYDPETYCFRWMVTLDNVRYLSDDTGIAGFIREACPSLLGKGDRVVVLHRLVKALYK